MTIVVVLVIVTHSYILFTRDAKVTRDTGSMAIELSGVAADLTGVTVFLFGLYLFREAVKHNPAGGAHRVGLIPASR